MIRRLALILALLSPLAGSAQTAGNVTILPAAFGVDDCTSTTTAVAISWTTSVTIVDGDLYRVYASTNSTCSTSAVATGTKIGSDFTATSATQSFTGGLTRSEFITATGASCTAGGAGSTLWVCVQHVRGTVLQAAMSGSATLVLSPPPVPVAVSVAPGDGALYVSWADGAANGVAASSYEVTAVASSPPNAADTHTQSFTSTTSNRVTGLTNGVTYSVTVRSVSAGSNKSASTAEVLGTPAPVSDFWDAYTAAGGREQGGCGGGAAGLVSLLGVALALRGLRRKS
jgi:hypothetical protein